MFKIKNSFNKCIRKSIRGISLVSAVAGIGLTSVVIGVMSNLMLRLSVETRENRLILTRDQMKVNMDLLLMNKRTIDNSIAQNATANKDLSTCLLGSSNPTDKCIALDVSNNPQKVPFTLYPPSASHAVSGPLGTPVYYSDNGSICPNPIPGKGCPFTIETWFIADCGGAADCAKAADANFYYEIKRVEGNPIRPGTNVDLPMAWSTLKKSQGEDGGGHMRHPKAVQMVVRLLHV